MFTNQKRIRALQLYEETHSVTEAIRILGYPGRQTLYKWIREKNQPQKKKSVYTAFPFEHWTRIRTNNVIERLNREIRRRTRVVGTFSDGNSALMLVCARLRHVAGTQWGNKKYMNMKHLEASIEEPSAAG